jgi:NAD(P)-dependent dehydrogenase (short-subunit alcohol dehydrogenase family)
MAILDDKVAVISASGQDIGREIALLMAREGARVLVNDTDADNEKKANDPATDRQSAQEIEDCPGRTETVTENVEMWSGGERLIDAAIDRFGRVDILVNAASFLPDKTFHQMKPKDWDAALNRQLKGAFICTRFAADRMRQQKWGRIIYIISARALIGSPGQAGAAAANMAVAGLGRNAAIELKRFNVTSNCIAIFGRLQRGTAFSAPPGTEDRSPERGENQSTSGAAPLAVFLAGESAQNISGQIFGTRGAEVYLFSQPRPARSLHCSEGWTPESLAAMLEPAMKNNFEPLDQATEYLSWEPMI